MIRTPHRAKGAPALGALGPGLSGPFGEYGADEDDAQADEAGPRKTVMTCRTEGGSS